MSVNWPHVNRRIPIKLVVASVKMKMIIILHNVTQEVSFADECPKLKKTALTSNNENYVRCQTQNVCLTPIPLD